MTEGLYDGVSEKLLYGVNEKDFVILTKNDYDYSKNNNVMKLLNEYKKVLFDDNFNSRIDWLPEGITDIYLGSDFNQPLENLPSTVKSIKIRNYNEKGSPYNKFNQLLDYLPIGLETLYIWFNEEFNYPLDNLPPGLKYFVLFSNKFTQPLNNLPDSIEIIQISTFNYTNTKKLPANLKSINITEPYNSNYCMKYNILEDLEKKYPNAKFTYR